MYQNITMVFGNVSSISKEFINEKGNKYKWFDICSSNENIKSFFSIRISEKQYDKYQELLKVGAWVKVTGYLNSYLDKEKRRVTYVSLISLENLKEEINKTKQKKIFSIDKDGVETWQGKRCKKEFCSEEKQKEIDSLLSEYEINV